MPRDIPSRATCRHIPSSAAFDASYAGIPVAARKLAAELMNTIADSGSSMSSAAAATRKCARVLTANVWSHWAAVVPAMPRPSPIPTFSTRPSSPPSAAAESADHPTRTPPATPRRPAPPRRSALRRGPGRAVASAAPASRSAQATAAPSLAASTEMARPLPGGGSGSGDGRVPAPTTSTRRPVSRPCPGAVPVVGRERHEPSHIGVVPGGSGTVNAFSRYEISGADPHSDTSSTIPASPRKRCAAS